MILFYNSVAYGESVWYTNVYGIYVKKHEKNKGTTNDEDIIFEERLFAILNSREISDL